MLPRDKNVVFQFPLTGWEFDYLQKLIESDVQQRQSHKNSYSLAEDLLKQFQEETE